MTDSTNTIEDETQANDQHDLGGKYLTFFLSDEEYGLEILRVHEIFGLMPVTRVPRTAAHILGVINLRGKVIPVLDLRSKFGASSTEDTNQTCIIVVQANNQQVGVVVDRVSEVVDIPSDHIEPTPELGREIHTDYILGVGKLDSRVCLLIDIDKALSDAEREEMRKSVEAAAESDHPASSAA